MEDLRNKTFDALVNSNRALNNSNLYNDKTIIGKGINYQHFIRLRYETINKEYIRIHYGVKGWYLIWWLMCNAENIAH
jgi:hypothetical protein